jgi:type IV secretory pathway VirB2 component (pilin)
MFFNKKYLLALVCSLFLVLPSITLAVGLPQILPECASTGDCTLNDITGMLGTLARWLFGIVGSLALLAFMYGGFEWMTAMGDSGKVKKGTDMMFGAVIGIVIMFAAQALVNFAISAILPEDAHVAGTSCGDNKIYTTQDDETVCLTECEVQHQTWSCRTVTTITGRTEEERQTQATAAGCEISLCPGTTNVVCCPPGGRRE